MAYRFVLVSYLLCAAAGSTPFSDEKYAPLPDKIITAKTAFLQNDSREHKFADNVYRQLEQWGRWRVVTNRSEADVVVVLDHQERVRGSGLRGSYHNNFYMGVLDRESGETLWTGKRDVAIGSWGGVAKALVADLRKRLPSRAEAK